MTAVRPRTGRRHLPQQTPLRHPPVGGAGGPAAAVGAGVSVPAVRGVAFDESEGSAVKFQRRSARTDGLRRQHLIRARAYFRRMRRRALWMWIAPAVAAHLGIFGKGG